MPITTTVNTGQAADATWQLPLPARVGARCRWLRRQLRWLAVSLPRRALSVALRLSWRLDLTVDVYVMVDADDAATAAHTARRLLADDQAAIAVVVPDRPWRELGRAHPDHPQPVEVRPTGYDGEFCVHAVITVGVTAAARDVDADRLGYLYAELNLPEFGRHDYYADAAGASRRPVPVHEGSRPAGLNRS